MPLFKQPEAFSKPNPRQNQMNVSANIVMSMSIIQLMDCREFGDRLSFIPVQELDEDVCGFE